MPKRARGRKETRLKKLAAQRESLDSSLSKSGWSSLGAQADEDEDEEFDYEQPRKFQVVDDEDQVERLPLKTQSGQVVRVVGKKVKKAPVEPETESESESESEAEEDQSEDEPQQPEEDKEEFIDESTVSQATVQAAVLKLQEEIADMAESLTEDPETNIGYLRQLRELYKKQKYVRAKQIALLAMVPIFKNLIPGYRIRPLTELEQKEKVSKDVRNLRAFEQGLLANYHLYVTLLQDLAKKGKGTSATYTASTMADTAISAAAELVESVPHFNYRTELVTILVSRVVISTNKSYDELPAAFKRVIQCMCNVFAADEEGQVTFDFIKLLSKAAKAKKYKLHESLITSLLHLRLLGELTSQADLERVQKMKYIKPETKIKKKDRVHLSKTQRKARKEQKAIDLEMMKAEHAVSAEERERLQAETLKMVFVLYFNILKERSQNNTSNSKKLIGATLEGLAKFSHLVNADLFGDLLEVVRELVLERQKRLVVDSQTSTETYETRESLTREALLCVITAFALLLGQDNAPAMLRISDSMNLDLSFFINHLYSSLYALALNPDIEFSHKTLRLDDPLKSADNETGSTSATYYKNNGGKNRVNISTEMEMLIRAFEFVFFRQRNVSPIRVKAFAKRIAVMSLQLPERSCLAALRVLDKMIQRFSGVKAMFSSEDKVLNGVYNYSTDDIEQSNADTASIWETVLLAKHYSPMVVKAAKHLNRSAK